MSKPVITPAKWLKGRIKPQALDGCTIALVGYCRDAARRLRPKISAVRLRRPLVSHLNDALQYSGRLGSVKVLSFEQVYGGPVSSVIIEELAHFGIRRVIGYGLAGSLTPDLPIGSIVLVASGAVSDGASKAYAPEAELVFPDPLMAGHVRSAAATCGIGLHEVRAWTTDALYRQYPAEHDHWRQRGCQVVNMDTSHLYAVSRSAGISAVYVAAVSDLADGGQWTDDPPAAEAAIGTLHGLLLETVRLAEAT